MVAVEIHIVDVSPHTKCDGFVRPLENIVGPNRFKSPPRRVGVLSRGVVGGKALQIWRQLRATPRIQYASQKLASYFTAVLQ